MKVKDLGKWGEELAILFLKEKGYKILARNYRNHFGEIDIIASLGEKIIFLDVKTRYSAQSGLPEEAINPKKIQKILKTAQLYLLKNNLSLENFRLEVIALEIRKDGFPEIRHYKEVGI